MREIGKQAVLNLREIGESLIFVLRMRRYLLWQMLCSRGGSMTGSLNGSRVYLPSYMVSVI